jgi:adenylate cyclase
LVPATAVLASVLGGAYQLFLTRQARLRVVDLFGRYVPRAVVDQLMHKPDIEAVAIGGVRRSVTVMFADIRGFTTFSEKLAPEAVLQELNSLLDGMVSCTFQRQGTLDKFIGDAVLVLFNAPLDQPDHVDRAVSTALEIQQRLAGHPSGLSIGIGIHTGDAVVGNIGTPDRMEYTAIGSTVNIASRLCDAARPGEIIVSAEVARLAEQPFEFESRAPISVKGIGRDLEILAVVAPQSQA